MTLPTTNTLNPLLSTYRELTENADKALEQADQTGLSSDESMHQKIHSILNQWFTFWNSHHASLMQLISSDDFEILRHFQQTMKTYSSHSFCPDALKDLILQVLDSCAEVNPGHPALNFTQMLPNDVLILIFQKFVSIKDMLAWGSICKKTQNILMTPQKWLESEAFKLLAHDDQQVELQRHFLLLLDAFGKVDGSRECARQLATHFFNQASDQVIAQFLSRDETALIETFLRLLIPEQLNRTSLTIWPKYAQHCQILDFNQCLGNLQELNLQNLPGALEDGFLSSLLNGKSQLKSLSMLTPKSGQFLEKLASSKETLEILEIKDGFALKKGDGDKLAAFKKLRKLQIWKNDAWKDEDLKFLNGMGHLEALDLSYCQGFNGSFFPFLAPSAQTLQSLTLRGCAMVASSGLKALPSCPNLKTFELTKAGITDDGIAHLAIIMPTVLSLNLEDCRQLTGASLNAISDCRQLQALVCKGWKEITDGHITALNGMASLQKLNLSKAKGFDGSGFNGLRLPSLQELDLSACKDFKAENHQYLAAFSATLEILNLSNSSLSDSLTFLQSMAKLRALNLQGCENLQDSALTALKHVEKTLEELNISYTPISDAGAESLAQAGNLAKLEMAGIAKLTDGFLKIAERLDKLNSLNIIGASQITLQGINNLKAKAPGLIITHNARK